MAIIKSDFICELNRPVKVQYLDGNLFSQDNMGNVFNVYVMDGDTPAVISGTVTADVIRSDGGTVAVSGSISGNACSVTFPQAVYAVPGVVSIVIKLTNSGTVTTLCAVVANVYRSSTDVVIDPGTIIQDITALISAIDAAVASIPLDYSDLWKYATGTNDALDGVVNTLFSSVGDVSNGYYNITTGQTMSSTSYVKTSKFDYLSGKTVRFVIGTNYMQRALFWNKTTGDYIPEKLTPWHTEKDGFSVYVGENENVALNIKRVDGGTIGTSGQSAVESTMRMYIVGNDNGLLSDLLYTSLLQCTENGVYRCGSAYTSELSDLPIGYDNGAFNLFVVKPSFASYDFATQTIIALDGSKWERVINRSGGTWTVYTGHDWVKTYDASDVPAKQSQIYKNVRQMIVNTQNAYWNVETSVAVKTSIEAQFQASDPIPVAEGDIFTLTARQGTTDKTRIWVITDDSYNIVAMCENFSGTALHTVTFTVPAGGTLLLLTKQQNSSVQTLYKKVSALDMLTNSLFNKRLSLLGDSISAYAGTIPDGNDAYYTGSNSGVSSPDQMWWKILCDKTGMIPLVINGWSGSGVNWQTESQHTTKVPMSDDSRCGNLHNGTIMPDVIIIAGGVNDYTYAQQAQSEPLEWDGKSAPTYTEPTTGKIVYNSFTEAYVAMIKKLQTNYPNAIIIALSTWFTMRGNDNGYVLTHTVGSGTSARVYSQQDYNDKIRFVAEQMHIPYIDVSNIGFNRNNFYPTYAEDSSTIPTHPNKNGQYVMGSAITSKIIDLINGYFN